MVKLSERGKRVCAVVGMATLWPSLFNQLLYPVGFTFNKTGDPAVYSFHTIYSLLLIGIIVALTANYRRTDKFLLSNGKLLSFFGVCGAAGILAEAWCDFSSTASVVLIGVGVGLVALYVPTHFLFWSMQFAKYEKRHVMCDAAASVALFALFTAVRLTLGLHALQVTVACPLISTLLAVLITSDETGYESCRGNLGLRELPLSFIVPCLVLVVLCNLGILLFNTDARLQTQPPHRNMLYWAVFALFAVLAVMFGPLGRQQRGVSVKALVLVLTFSMGALLASYPASSVEPQGGSVPLIAANTALSCFIWVVLVRDANRRRVSPTLPAALFLVVVVVVPRTLRAFLMYKGKYLPALQDSMALFCIIAASAFLAVVLIIAVLMKFFMQPALLPAEERAELDEADEFGAFAWLQRTFGLTDREVEVAKLASKNMSAKEMAEVLFITESTVYTHFKHIYAKCGVHSKQQLAELVDGYRR